MRRLMGLELEYTAFRRLVVNGDLNIENNSNPPLEKEIASLFPEVVLVPYSFGRPFFGAGRNRKWNTWLANGGKFYNDGSAWEYATPECITAKDIALVDKAADITLKKFFSYREDQENLFLMKRSATRFMRLDGTWGAHENYTVSTDLFNDLMDQESISVRRSILEMHLVSRIVFTGAGHIQYDTTSHLPSLHFWLSPRVRFLTKRISHGTRAGDRAIINTRDESHFGRSDYSRFHIIPGDMNRSDWSTYLKVGTTALVLAYLEIAERNECIELGNFLRVDDPLEIMKRGSNPYEDNVGLELFEAMIKWQRQIFKVIENNRDRIAAMIPDVDEVLNVWDKVLTHLPDALDSHDNPLSDKLDWVIKKKIFEGRMERSMDEIYTISSKEMIRKLTLLDLSYHRLNHKDLYRRLVESGYINPMFSYEQAERFVVSPPPGRAKNRVDTIRYIDQEHGILDKVVALSWSKLKIKLNDTSPSIDLSFCADDFSVIKSNLDEAIKIKREQENGGEQ